MVKHSATTQFIAYKGGRSLSRTYTARKVSGGEPGVVVYMTRAAVRKAQARVEEINTTDLPRIATELHDAGRLKDGDSERVSLLTKLQQLEAEKRGLSSNLSRAQVRCGSTQRVEIGSAVTFRNLETGEVLTLILVSTNGNPREEGTISTESPVGRVLFERCAGDEVEVPTVSKGKMQRLKIEAVIEGEF